MKTGMYTMVLRIGEYSSPSAWLIVSDKNVVGGDVNYAFSGNLSGRSVETLRALVDLSPRGPVTDENHLSATSIALQGVRSGDTFELRGSVDTHDIEMQCTWLSD
jgi:hypothetical protein